MKRTHYLANRLQEVLLNGKWIANTNLKEQIQNLHWETAIKKAGNLNSIALLVFHLNYYIKGIYHFFETGKLEISDRFSFDMPEIKSEEDWKKLVSEILVNAERLVGLIREMEDEQLGDVFADEKYGNYERNIEGLIEHCYYHLGQASLLIKSTNFKF
jgi:uncharacterized damage-inducible protein DinB